jgi:hypothetical protein
LGEGEIEEVLMGVLEEGSFTVGVEEVGGEGERISGGDDETAIGNDGPAAKGGKTAGGDSETSEDFFLDLGVLILLCANLFPIAERASPTSLAVPLMVTDLNPDVPLGGATEILAWEKSWICLSPVPALPTICPIC